MTFKTLYSRTNTGAIQQWQVIVGENFYRTIYGQKDGQLVTTDPSLCLGKNLGKANETSPAEQAVKEAQALYKKKLKEGYKEDLSAIDDEGFFEPQLAKQFEDYKDKVKYPLALESKLNGIRCILTAKGAFSRKGEEFFCLNHVKEEAAKIVDFLVRNRGKNFIVNCKAGISRSAAICKFLEECFDYEWISGKDRARPNGLLFDLLKLEYGVSPIVK